MLQLEKALACVAGGRKCQPVPPSVPLGAISLYVWANVEKLLMYSCNALDAETRYRSGVHSAEVRETDLVCQETMTFQVMSNFRKFRNSGKWKIQGKPPKFRQMPPIREKMIPLSIEGPPPPPSPPHPPQCGGDYPYACIRNGLYLRKVVWRRVAWGKCMHEEMWKDGSVVGWSGTLTG